MSIFMIQKRILPIRTLKNILQQKSYGDACEEERPMWCQTAYRPPKVILNNGKQMPLIGLGTWGSPKGQVVKAVKDAIDVGYRHIDCAHVYQNEDEVGQAIQCKIEEGIVKREDLFITSKLWNTMHRSDLVRSALEDTLHNLKLKYLDLYLIHWPMAYKEGCELFPTDDSGKTLYSDVHFIDTWKEMEKLVKSGLTKSIGISNFNKSQIECLLKNAKIKPATNQIECHPYLTQKKLADFCKCNDIAITAYSPLGSPARPWAKPDDPLLLGEPKLCEMAKQKKKEVAQLLIRYQIQRGNVVIPKSVNKERIKSNFSVFNFELSDEEMKEIHGLNRNERYVPLLKEAGCHPLYPFHDEY